MPKRRDRSVSSDRFTASPFLCRSTLSNHPFAESCLENEDNVKEWEETRCPVCMEHPHNAILLLCSSHDKGCRPFMCDTSYRHSNCFDQFQKSFTKDPETPEEATITDKPKLMCPLCRGEIDGWIIVDPARCFMNAKARSCSCESCDFTGTYSDLRKHARAVHPSERPMVADPERQRNWNRLERRRDLGDLLSSLQASIGGESNMDIPPEFDESNWLTVFFLVRVFRAGSNRVTSGRRRSRRLLVESTDEEVESGSGNEFPDIMPAAPGPSETTTVISRRRLRRLREVSPDVEVQEWSSDGEIEHSRRLRRRRRPSTEN